MRGVKRQGWSNPVTARKYYEHTRRFPNYKNTSRDLVNLAGIREGMTVVDLACGTGMTTEALLEKMGETGRICAVDASPAMLAIAKRVIQASNVAFFHGPAELLDEVIRQPVERIVCNSGFWHMDMPQAAQKVAAVLRDDGKFVFSMPSEFFRIPGEAHPEAPSPRMRLRERMYEIAQREYGYVLPEGWQSRRKLDFADIRAAFAHVLELHSYHVIWREILSASIYDSHRIPNWTDRSFPELSYKIRMEILEKAYREMEWPESFQRPWIYFVAQKQTSALFSCIRMRARVWYYLYMRKRIRI